MAGTAGARGLLQTNYEAGGNPSKILAEKSSWVMRMAEKEG